MGECEMKLYINEFDHMSKMASMPMYGKTHKISSQKDIFLLIPPDRKVRGI